MRSARAVFSSCALGIFQRFQGIGVKLDFGRKEEFKGDHAVVEQAEIAATFPGDGLVQCVGVERIAILEAEAVHSASGFVL